MEKKVLVVDDEETVRKILKLHLSKLGYEVNEAADGLQALERLRKDDFGLLRGGITWDIWLRKLRFASFKQWYSYLKNDAEEA